MSTHIIMWKYVYNSTLYIPEYRRLISDNIQLTPHPYFLVIVDFLTSISTAVLCIKLAAVLRLNYAFIDTFSFSRRKHMTHLIVIINERTLL